MDDIKTIVKRIGKPLDFAARDDFAHVKGVALEPFMRAQLSELRCCSADPDALQQLEALFSGFDALPADQKKDRVIRATAVIAALETSCIAPVPMPAVTSRTQVRVSSPHPTDSAAIPIALDTPIQFCKGIGPKRAELLRKIGIHTVEDSLFYIPWRYEDRGNLKKIGRISIGSYETVIGEVVSAEVIETKRKWVKVFELLVTDKSGMLIGSWYNQAFMKKSFKPGQKVVLSGIVKSNPYRSGLPQIDNPEYEIMEDSESDNLIHAGRMVPIYRTTSGLSVRYLRSMMKAIIDSCGSTVPDIVPLYIIKKYSLLSAAEAIAEAHFPEEEKDITVLNRGESAAHRRMSFEELFTLELGLALRKQGRAAAKKGIAFMALNTLESALRAKLPYRLTSAQERVIAEIKTDMTGDRPMNRLVQGDVGCGKTIVAMIAALMAVENGYQACLMAPTEILAAQHFKNIEDLALPLGITVRHLVGGLRKKAKETILAEIGSGAAGIVVGTHALIEQNVQFKRLGLAIIDEQHRFGVMQRSTLTSKGYEPDVLVMTATPIPRTLALTVYGDLDVSIIDEIPPGRSPIVTKIYFEPKRREAYQFLEEELRKGRQAYVVYPLVEETEKSDLKAATEMAAHIQKDIFPRWRVGLLHGRMKANEKEAAMAAFKANETHILISTTVVEVGVDVPNATVMVIEHPERFGLAQLHQLRGRVGRGGHQSTCILMGPRMFADEARERLNAFARTTDGFKIAEEDLRMRGPGEFLGTRQSGLPDLRAANIIRDADLLEKARREAFELVEQDAVLAQYPQLRIAIGRRWQGKLGLISVG